MGRLTEEKRREQVYKILLAPINEPTYSGHVGERKVIVAWNGSHVDTTQTYWPEYKDANQNSIRYPMNRDCDISDVACGFYEIIYRDILPGHIVCEDGNLFDKEFAGDTMNTVKKMPGLTEKYHCLANFWLLPMKLGRMSDHELSKTDSKYAIQDYMDRFLIAVQDKFEEYRRAFPRYFAKIRTFEEMVNVHSLEGSHVERVMSEDLSEEKYVVQTFSDMPAVFKEETVWNYIKKRARVIADSQYGEELERYFISLGLIKDD